MDTLTKGKTKFALDAVSKFWVEIPFDAKDYRITDIKSFVGGYYPPSLAKKLDPIRVKLMDDIKYYNLYAQFDNDLYIYLINGIRLRDDYGRISQLIAKELNNRGIQISGN